MTPSSSRLSTYLSLPILAVAAILDATVMPEFRLGGGRPDLVFMLVVSWALLADLREALTWAVVGGVMQDWLSLAPLGTSALGMVVVAFAADSLFGQIRRGNILPPLLIVSAGTAIYHLGILAVLRLSGYEMPIGLSLSYVTLPTMIYNTILIVPVFRLAGLLYGGLHPRRVRLE